MKIEFYIIKTNEVTESDGLLVYNNQVWCDNGLEYQSQEPLVSFEDFIEPMPNLGWRVI